jgi:hypothetical protein
MPLGEPTQCMLAHFLLLTDLEMTKIVVSPENCEKNVEMLVSLGMSALYIEKRVGKRKEPCGTPPLSSFKLKQVFPNLVKNGAEIF